MVVEKRESKNNPSTEEVIPSSEAKGTIPELTKEDLNKERKASSLAFSSESNDTRTETLKSTHYRETQKPSKQVYEATKIDKISELKTTFQHILQDLKSGIIFFTRPGHSMHDKVVADSIAKKANGDTSVFICNFPLNHYLRVAGMNGTSFLLNLNRSVAVIAKGALTFFPWTNATDPQKVFSSSTKGKTVIANWDGDFKVTNY